MTVVDSSECNMISLLRKPSLDYSDDTCCHLSGVSSVGWMGADTTDKKILKDKMVGDEDR